MNGALPFLIDHPKHPAASLVVGVDVVTRLFDIYLLHALSCGDVISIDVEHLFVALDRQVVAAGLEEAVGFVERLGYLLALRRKLRRDCLVVVIRLFKIGWSRTAALLDGSYSGSRTVFATRSASP